MRKIDEIIVHCAATHPNWWEGKSAEEKRDEIRRWHVQDNGWDDIGYHAIIDRDGTVAQGREDAVQGAHCKGRNATTLGVCLLGGHGSNENDKFEDHFTPAQDRALRLWIEHKQNIHPTIKTVSGHNQYAAKACPGFNVPRWVAHKPPVATTPIAEKRTQLNVVQTATAVSGALGAASAFDGTAQIVFLGLAGLGLVAGIVLFRDDIRDWLRRKG